MTNTVPLRITLRGGERPRHGQPRLGRVAADYSTPRRVLVGAVVTKPFPVGIAGRE